MAGPLLKFATEGEYRERENGATRKRGGEKGENAEQKGGTKSGKKGSVNEMSFGRIKVVAHKYQSRSSSSSSFSLRVHTRRERNRLVINRLGRLGHSAKRSRSTHKGLTRESTRPGRWWHREPCTRAN